MTTYIVSSGQTSSGVTLNSGDSEIVLSGGTAFATTVNSGGLLTVLSSGVAEFTTVNSSGSETVSAGGSTTSDTIGSGGSLAVSGGTADATTINGGSETVFLGGTATPLAINSGGSLTVSFGGSEAHGTIRGSGLLTVLSGGSARDAAIEMGGSEIVSGGTASGDGILNGGLLTVLAGGLTIGDIMDSGGLLIVSSGGTAISTGVDVAGALTVSSGGAVSSASIFGGLESGLFNASGVGSLTVLSGGIANNATIRGGLEVVSSGGTTVNTVISGSGSQFGLSELTSWNGGVVDLLSGAVVSGGISLVSAGGQLQIQGSAMPSNTISGFVPGDTFDLTSIAFDSAGTATLGSGDVLHITESGTTYDLNLSQAQFYTGDFFHLASDGVSGTLVTEDQNPCFCRGTLIRTATGEVPVEKLAVGDRVATLSGSFKPIVWVGFGRDLVTRANRLARPIVVRRGALADNVPRRDLYLTHGHALFTRDVLIPVEHLVNHRSIAWDDTARVVEYYHIELADHDVLFAEGAPAESYHDAGNRAAFQNTRPGHAPGAQKPTCAPVLNGGEIVETLWAELFERAGLQIETNTTDDADLHLAVDGERLDPAAMHDGVYTFAVERPPAGALRLRSRSSVPSLVGLSRHDHRPLGVAIKQIVLQHAGIPTSFAFDAPQLREGGCYLPEDGYCWTDGEFELPARFVTLLDGAFGLVVHTQPHYDMRYPLSARVSRAA